MFFESFLCDLRHIVLLRVAPRVLGLVCFLLFSRLRGLASCLAGVCIALGCLCACGCERASVGPLGVWRVSHGCGFDTWGLVCIMKGARFKGKPRQRGGGREVPRRGTNNE